MKKYSELMKNFMEVSEKSVDTNVLLYLNQDVDPGKRIIAESILDDEQPVVSAQAVSEYLCEREKEWRKARPKGTPFNDEAKAFVLDTCADDLDGTFIQHVDVNTLKHAKKLVRLHHFQLRDAVIVASSVEAGCTILYSEDMKNEDIVDQQLTIRNPFVMEEFIQQTRIVSSHLSSDD
jgi:predicted nucleic acid-binding protein